MISSQTKKNSRLVVARGSAGQRKQHDGQKRIETRTSVSAVEAGDRNDEPTGDQDNSEQMVEARQIRNEPNASGQH